MLHYNHNFMPKIGKINKKKIDPKMKENAIEMYPWMTRTRALIKYTRAAKIYLINTLKFG